MSRFSALGLMAAMVLCLSQEDPRSRGTTTPTTPDPPSTRKMAKRDLASQADKAVIVAEHNKYRQLEGAADMFALKYNDYLADMANEWARRCEFNHGHPIRTDRPWPWIGQNLYAISLPKINYTRAILSWFVEKNDFQFDQVSCNAGRVCGHYTQVVWHETTDVGCAAAICPSLAATAFTNAGFIVCNYGPGGNYIGEKPYDKGAACTECPEKTFCKNGLCVSVKEENQQVRR